MHDDLNILFNFQLFLVRNKLMNKGLSKDPASSSSPSVFINRLGAKCSTESVNYLLQLLVSNIFPSKKLVITCQMLRKVNQTHFFRSSPSIDEIKKFNALADHSFNTSWAYYQIFKDSETLFSQMSSVPESHSLLWK